MTIKTYQTLKVFLSIAIVGLIYHFGAPYTEENLLFFQIVTITTVILIIVSAFEEYTKLFRR